MKEVTITLKGTLMLFEYCSKDVMDNMVKTEGCSRETAFFSEFYKVNIWSKIDALYIDGDETNNLIRKKGQMVETSDYFHRLFRENGSHPLPVELHYWREKDARLRYTIELEDDEDFDIGKLQMICTNEMTNDIRSRVVILEISKLLKDGAIIAKKVIYDGQDFEVDFDDYDKFVIEGRPYDSEQIDYWYQDYGTKEGELVIPEGTKELELDAFMNRTDFTRVVIPNSVTEISSGSFQGCTGLQSITIPDSVTKIGQSAFEGCTGLQSIVIPNSMTLIDYFAFSGCTKLKSIIIPDSVEEVGSGVSRGCNELTSIVVTDGNKFYDSRNNCNAIIEIEGNKLIAGCATTVIPNTINTIEREAFAGCSSLTSVAIPNSVTKIGNGAFKGCTGLTSITIPDSVTNICYSAFKDCSSLTEITIPVSVTELGWSGEIFANCTGLKSVVIQAKLKKIEVKMFSGCTSLETVTLPAGIGSISKDAFEGCTALKTINVPAKKADYYKKRLPENLHSLIVELPAEKKK